MQLCSTVGDPKELRCCRHRNKRLLHETVCEPERERRCPWAKTELNRRRFPRPGLRRARASSSGDGYPDSEEEWDLKTSSVYPNITGADLDQIQQAIDTLLNFAPLTELATAVDDASFDDKSKKEFRSVIAQRYLAQENFAEAKKFMPPDEFKLVAANLETLTKAAAGNPQEKAEDMLKLGNAWAEARGKLLRAPLDTKVHFLRRYGGLDAMQRRANGRSLSLKNVDPELEERDELRHASRWWLNAAGPGPELRSGRRRAGKRWTRCRKLPRLRNMRRSWRAK